MSYTIVTETTKRIVAGVLKIESFSYVADKDGALVGKKAHNTVEEAQAELDGMGFYLTGLEFARAQFPKDGEKAHVAKANIVARFLSWEAAGRPVVEVDADEEPQGSDAQPEPEADETF